MKKSFTHYYIQAQADVFPKTIYHTKNETTGELYHKFIDRKKALELLASEKEAFPNDKFRLMKFTETYDPGKWI